jgi:hypothetical protein
VIEIAEKEGGLVLQLGLKKERFPLQHDGQDKFAYQPSERMLTA